MNRVNPSSSAPVQQCTICTEDMDQVATIRTLACMHIFHTACVNLWLETKNTCPLCRLAQPDERPLDADDWFRARMTPDMSPAEIAEANRHEAAIRSARSNRGTY